MSYESDPPRLSEGGSGAPELQNLFQSARQDLPSDKAIDRILTRLGPIAGAGAALAGDAVIAGAKTAATQAATSSTLSASLAKIVAAVAGAGLIAGGAAIVASKGGDKPEPPTPVLTAPQAPVVPPPAAEAA